jgi:ABC-type sugar transport system permease subunit
MKKLKSLLGNIVATIYFIFPMCLVLLMLIFMPIFFLTDVSTVRSSGFAGANTSTAFIGICGLFIGLSLLIQPLKKMYRVLPWLYSFIKIFYVNLIILSIGLTILNIGYQVQNDARHTMFFILMIVQVVVCRISMCIYFKLKPVEHIEER